MSYHSMCVIMHSLIRYFLLLLCKLYKHSAMQREHKVMRLEWEAIHVNYSYLLDQMAPDEVLPHLAARRLLTPEKVREVQVKTNRLQKITTILEALCDQRIVGLLPTFCTALASTTGQDHIAETLTHCEYIMCAGFFVPSLSTPNHPPGCSVT